MYACIYKYKSDGLGNGFRKTYSTALRVMNTAEEKSAPVVPTVFISPKDFPGQTNGQNMMRRGLCAIAGSRITSV